MIARIIEALNVLLGRPLDPYLGWRSPVHTRPEAWRCSICGGGIVSGPPGRPLFHNCRGHRTAPGRRIRYVGLRAHAARVWGAAWGNRPRWASAQPAHGEGPNPRTRVSDDGCSIELRVEPDLPGLQTRRLLSWQNGSGGVPSPDPFRLDGGSEL